MENNPEAAMDKSKPWSRSIEDLHGGGTLPSPITGNGITRAGRHSTLRYDAHTLLSMVKKDSSAMCVCNFDFQDFFFLPPHPSNLVLSRSNAVVL